MSTLSPQALPLVMGGYSNTPSASAPQSSSSALVLVILFLFAAMVL